MAGTLQSAALFATIQPAVLPEDVDSGAGLEALQTSNAPGLYVVAADGTSLTSVSDSEEIYSWAWSYKGSELAVSAGQCKGASTLSIFDAESSTQRILGSQRVVSGLAWTDSGELLLRIGEAYFAPASLVVVDGQTGVPDPPLAEDVWWHVISPDGTRVAYVVAVEDSYGELWSYEFASGRHTLLAEKASYADMAWSPDAKLLAYQTEKSALAVVSADGSRNLTLNGADYGSSNIVWLPDGSGVLYARPAPNEGYDLAVQFVSTDGSASQVLAKGANFSLSSDGRRLAIYGLDQPLRVVDLTDGHATIVSADLVPFGLVEFSPDGGKVLFNAVAPADVTITQRSPDLYVVNSDGTGRLKLVNSVRANSVREINRATWSSDGRYIAFWDVGIRECH